MGIEPTPETWEANWQRENRWNGGTLSETSCGGLSRASVEDGSKRQTEQRSKNMTLARNRE